MPIEQKSGRSRGLEKDILLGPKSVIADLNLT